MRNIDCLHILRLNEHKTKVNPKVLEEMRRLRSTRLLNLCVPSLDSISDTNVIKILFQNVRSLHLHVHDVLSDFNVQAADINLFVETALNSKHKNDMYTLEGYNLFRNHIEPQIVSKTPYGSAVYIRNSVDVFTPPCRYNYNDVEITVTVINHPTIDHIYVVSIYRSPTKVKFSKLIESLDHLQTTQLFNQSAIIFGDFNVDLSKDSHEHQALLLNMVQSSKDIPN